MLDLADPPLGRAGERAGLVAEHFALEQIFRQAAAVDGHEIVLAATAVIVQATSHHFLAGSGFANHQHVGRRIGDIEDQPAQAFDGR